MSETTDMSSVIVPKSDQINADDFLAGPRTITVTAVKIRPGTEQPVSIHFDGDGGKPFKPCKSMARVMVHCWGPDASKYVGHSMTLYCDPKVKWGGLEVGGIRISHLSHIEKDVVMVLTETKGSRKPFKVKPLVISDKVADGVDKLVGRINGADKARLEAITADPDVVKQRAWLDKSRPDLAQRVTNAITAALSAMETDADTPADAGAPTPAGDGWPGEAAA